MKGECFGNPKEAFFSPVSLRCSQGGCLFTAIKFNQGKEFGQDVSTISCRAVCVPAHSGMCASLLIHALLLSPWSLLGVTNHRRTAFQTRVVVYDFFIWSQQLCMSLRAQVRRFFKLPSPDKCSLRTLFINLFAGPGLIPMRLNCSILGRAKVLPGN